MVTEPAAGAPAPARTLVSVVLPVYNEVGGLPKLFGRVRDAILKTGARQEIIFVDDNSPDGTANFAKSIGASDARVRCIRRVGRRGLAGACMEGSVMLLSVSGHDAYVLGPRRREPRRACGPPSGRE